MQYKLVPMEGASAACFVRNSSGERVLADGYKFMKTTRTTFSKDGRRRVTKKWVPGRMVACDPSSNLSKYTHLSDHITKIRAQLAEQKLLRAEAKAVKAAAAAQAVKG